MAKFRRGSLQYQYSWTASKEGDNNKITGFPDSYLIDRQEGYEVLPFINRYMEHRGWSSESTFHKIEKAIRETLPGKIRGHRTIREWLDSHL